MNSFLGALQFSLIAFSSIFFLVDPFAAVPTFLGLTAGITRDERRRIARRAAWTCFVVLSVFAAAGSLIFKLFGITLPAFEIAGGLILLLIGLEMLQAQRSATQESPGEVQEAAQREDVGVIPMGIPMLAGPGAISTVMVLMAQSPRWWQAVPVFVAIAVSALAAYIVLSGADRVSRLLGETGIRILMRLMGLLLTAIAIQFMINGFAALGLVHIGARGR